MNGIISTNILNGCSRDVGTSGSVTKAHTLGGASMARSISGIYQIRNLANGNQYIGSAKDIYKRWAIHVCQLNKNKHHSQYLQRSWNKYGADCFEFAVIEECHIYMLVFREQYYINLYQPVYNIAKIAGSTLGTKRSAESRAKMSAKRKLSTPRRQTLKERLKRSLSAMGHEISQATKDKISAALIGRPASKGFSGHKHSEESKLKTSETFRIRRERKKNNAG
jgi:group I intron endonuclease